MVKKPNGRRIRSFDLPEDTVFAGKYRVIEKLGGGWEGEVYRIIERGTGIERAAKIFYPQRNRRGLAAKRYAKKLHKLRHCPGLIQYHTAETFECQGTMITALISDYVEGQILADFLKQQPGGRLRLFEAMHLLYSLVQVIEKVHAENEYHGDLHPWNVMVSRYGLSFDVRIIDLINHGRTSAENRHDDICDLIRIFYECLGGQRYYSRLHPAAKYIICGQKRSLILEKFRTAAHLRLHLETMDWQD
jgi:serine/threonine protein kinase